MKTSSSFPVYLVAILATAALVSYSVFVLAAFMGWTLLTDYDSDRRPTPTRSSVAPADTARGPLAAARCGRCGVVESVREVRMAQNAAGIGAAAGGMTGTAIVLQAGGRGDLLAAIGALLGAMVGNRYEDRAVSTGLYEVAVRYEDGSSRVLPVLGEPAWKAGDRVRIIGGRIWPDG